MAAGKHRVDVEVGARVDVADKKIKKLEKTIGRLEKKMDKASKSAGEMGKKMGSFVAAYASVEGIRALDNLVQESIKFDNVMGNLPFSIDKARASTKNLISDFDLSKSAVAAHALGITKNAEQYAKFSEAAVKLGSKLGIDTPAAMEQLTAAVGRGSAKILDNFGIMAKGFESMNMEQRLELISKAANDTTLAVDENAQAWNRLKNDLDNLKNETFPAVVGFAGMLVDNVRDITDAMEAAAFDVRARDWGEAVDGVAKSYFELMKASIPLNAAVDDLADAFESDVGPAAATYEEGLIRVHQITLANAEATETWMQKLRRMRGEIPNVNKFMMEALIGNAGKQSGFDAGALAAHKGTTAVQNRINERNAKKKRGKGEKVDPLTQLDSFGAGDRFSGGPDLEGLDLGGFQREREADDLEKQNELLALNNELKVAGTRAEQESLQVEADLHRQRTSAIESAFDAEMRMAELRGQTHEVEVLGIQKQIALRNEEAEHARSNAELQKKLDEEVAAKRQQTSNAIVSMAGSQAALLGALAEAEGEQGKELAVAAAIAKGIQAMAVGAQITGEGIANIASYNYPTGIAQIAAGATNFAIGGALMAKDINSAVSAANGSSAAGGGGGPFQGLGGSDFGGSGAFGGSGGRPNSNIPASPNGQAPNGTGGSNGGGGNTVNIGTIQVTGTIDDETGVKIKQKLEEIDYSRGQVSA